MMLFYYKVKKMMGAFLALFSPAGKVGRGFKQAWTILSLAFKKFLGINGAQWAGAFAFNMFFSLFPIIVLFVTIASMFIERDLAGKEIIANIESYVPISGEMHNYVFETISGVIEERAQAGVIAFLILIWAAVQCFLTLIFSTNLAWGIVGYKKWWHLPLRSVALLSITGILIFLGMLAAVLMRLAKDWFFTTNDISSWMFGVGSFFIPLTLIFLGLSLFYMFAPGRPTRFAEVWIAALLTTFLLIVSESLFAIYLRDFATLNVVYGTFGGIMALLLWIYLCGCIYIFGTCLCAVQAEVKSQPLKTS